jgi:hypothetical protein
MVDPLATTMIRIALRSPGVDEYVSSLSYLLLVETEFEGHSILSGQEFQVFVGTMLSAGSRDNMQAGDRFLRDRISSVPKAAWVPIGTVQTGLRLAAGALGDSAELMRATYQMVRPESSKPAWWLTHAGCLGMCYWAARMGAAGEVPAREAVDYVGQYAGFLFQASGHEALAKVQDIVEVFQLASSAIYGVVEHRTFSAATRGPNPEEMARLVDGLTGGLWDFLDAIVELDRLWTDP